MPGSCRTAEAAAAALPRRDPQWLEVKIGAFYGQEQPAGMSVAEFALTLVQLLQTKRSSDDLQTGAEKRIFIGQDKTTILHVQDPRTKVEMLIKSTTLQILFFFQNSST